ncbi:MAG TPA: hypothetical protein VNJ01_18220 [Bacteriovoracaceae bacterium]|nr:hypothetical protein [Bacteriovoracaceae bacterium]
MRYAFYTLFLMNSFPLLACQPDDSRVLKLKNNMISEAASKYGADLSATAISVTGYQHQFQWKFTNQAWECHDSDLVTAVVELKDFKYYYDDSESCSVVTRVKVTSEPAKKNARAKVSTTFEEISRHCL